MVLSTCNVKIKGAAHKNGNVDGMCKQAFTELFALQFMEVCRVCKAIWLSKESVMEPTDAMEPLYTILFVL